MMNYDEALSYIHSLEKFGIKPGLERISDLLSALDNPQKDMKYIHVAGTNGKGSTSTYISNMILCNGYNVGLFTSPYVIDFRERIRFNGEMISKSELAQFTELVKDAIEHCNITITEFEAVTAIAFLYYKAKCCDYVVLEVGLGGRFDATNVIDNSVASVITSVSLDHMAILGDTVEKIAYEKCGIIKDGSFVVSYPLQKKDARRVISSEAAFHNCSVIIPDSKKLNIIKSDITGSIAEYDGISIHTGLSGLHMLYNCITAVETVRAALPSALPDRIEEGIAITSLPARIEVFSEKPLVLVDGGHNEDCALALNSFVKEHLKDKRIIMVSSLMADKDHKKYLEILLPNVYCFIATRAPVPRALDASSLEFEAKEYCVNTYCFEEPQIALSEARHIADENDVIIICGSFYLAGGFYNDKTN